MSEKEKNILMSIAKAVPNMSEFDKGYFLGVGETIVKYKNTDKLDDSGKAQEILVPYKESRIRGE